MQQQSQARGTSSSKRVVTDEQRAQMSERSREYWERMSSEEREARRAFIRGLWENAERRAIFRSTLSEIWGDYKASARYVELVDALRAAHQRD